MANNSAIKSYVNVCDKPACLGQGTPARVFFKGGVETTDQQPFINGTITALIQRGDGGWDATFTYNTATMPPDFVMVFPAGGVDGNVCDPDCFAEGDWAWKVQQLNSALLTPALSGDVSSPAGSTVTTLATVNTSPGPYGSVTAIPVVTVDGKGRVTDSTEVPIVIGSLTDLGDGVGDALGEDVGTAGAPVLFDGAGGTPSSLVLTNATGTPTAIGLANGTGLPIAGISGLGSTVAATLAINIGDNASMLTRNGALGTPTSGSLANCSLLPPAGVVGTAATLNGAETLTNKSITGSNLTMSGNITTSGSSGIGYTTGAGGTVTQTGSKTATVTLNKITGEITMHGASLAASTSVSFTLNNTVLDAGDYLAIRHCGTGTAGAYTVAAFCSADSAVVTVRNVTLGALAEAIVLQFVIIKAVNS